MAQGLNHYVGHAAGAIFAIILLNASIIGAAAVTLSTSYAFGDVFGARHSLHRIVARGQVLLRRHSRRMVVLAAVIVLIPGAPLGVITTGVQALAGVLLPSATVFLLLLCNDKAVLGPWVNRPWLNMVAVFIVSDPALMMSFVLMATTLFSTINVNDLAVVLGGDPRWSSSGRRRPDAAGTGAPPADGAMSKEHRAELAHASPQPARPPQVVEGSAHLGMYALRSTWSWRYCCCWLRRSSWD